MQLLELKKIKIMLLGFVLVTLARSVLANSTCDGNITRELEACARENFYLSDKNLNAEYRAVWLKLEAKDKDNLRDTHRLWIKYKITYCQKAFDEVSPGEEAGIDRWACLDRTTDVRLREMQYIDSKIDMRSFFQALTFIAQTYEQGDIGKVVKKLKDLPSAAGDRDWTSYVEANCEMTYSLLREEKDICVARQNFFKEW